MPVEIISSADAMERVRVPNAGWPKKPEAQSRRLSPVCLPAFEPSFRISREDRIFTIGSCFARNIEKHLVIEGYNVAARQLGNIGEANGVNIKPDILNKFVAGSITNELEWALNPERPFDDRCIIPVRADRFVDMQLAPGLMPAAFEQMRAIRTAVSQYMALVREAKVVILTLGLAEGWFDRTTNLYLNSPPHRGSLELFPDRFELHVLDYNDIVSSLERTITLLLQFGAPGVRVILTVSPVALGATYTGQDAMIANCYSKSVQRAAAGYIHKKYECVDYLPSYESVTLSERSVAWRDDCAHVSDEIVRTNVLRMLNAYTGEDSSDIDLQDLQDRARALHLSGRDAQSAIADIPAQLREAKRLAPDDAVVSFRLGQHFFDAGDFQSAAEELTHARRLGADELGAAYILGKALFRLQRYDEAVEPLKAAAETVEPKAGPLYLLGKALLRGGRPAEAIKYLEEAHAGAPEHQAIAATLESARSLAPAG